MCSFWKNCNIFNNQHSCDIFFLPLNLQILWSRSHKNIRLKQLSIETTKTDLRNKSLPCFISQSISRSLGAIEREMYRNAGRIVSDYKIRVRTDRPPDFYTDVTTNQMSKKPFYQCVELSNLAKGGIKREGKRIFQLPI